ncbi:thermonuclease family protein [Paeniglutamicibacter sp.]|uniref:thermonuclease family protein n=1 Tax=Paeniglutamicibacter sp. TaxID=1934391 RepID=UPI003988CC32
MAALASGRVARIVAGAVVLGFVATACTQVPTPQAERDRSGATVVRVIDGDTIVADLSGAETTIRLLNVDTPETKHPDQPVQCLGAEATDYTKSLLAPGDRIELAYDVQRLDPHGRTLAGVYKDGSLVNADIAAAGLGVAVLFQPNERFYPEVLAAEQRAQEASEGLYSAAIDCTIPARAVAAIAGLEAVEGTVPANAEAVGSALAVVGAAIVAGKAKSATLKALDTAGDAVDAAVWSARKSAYAPRLAASLDRATAIEKKLAARQAALARAKKEADAKEKAVAKAAAEARAKAKAEATRKANAAAERQAAASRLAAERRRQSIPKQTYQAPVQKPRPKVSSNPYPGYTGPRCYAPGGQTWKPC